MQELTVTELQDVNGGIVGAIVLVLIAIAGALVLQRLQ